MIRWYDYIFVIIFAYAILTNFILSVIGTTIFVKFMGGIGVIVFYDLWNNAYCKARWMMNKND